MPPDHPGPPLKFHGERDNLPKTGARFNFWHPDLVTLHVWLWYPNPDGLYNGTNPYIQPFNHG